MPPRRTPRKKCSKPRRKPLARKPKQYRSGPCRLRYTSDRVRRATKERDELRYGRRPRIETYIETESEESLSETPDLYDEGVDFDKTAPLFAPELGEENEAPSLLCLGALSPPVSSGRRSLFGPPLVTSISLPFA